MKTKLVRFFLSGSSFLWVVFFLFVWKKIDIPTFSSENFCYFSYINCVLIKYLCFLFIIYGIAYFSLKFAKTLKNTERMEIKEIKPIESTFLPVYIWLFVIALSFDSSLSVETIFLLFILFLFRRYLDSVSYFNPFFLFFWYRFYEVKSSFWLTLMLITKEKDLKSTDSIEWLIRINNFTFLQ